MTDSGGKIRLLGALRIIVKAKSTLPRNVSSSVASAAGGVGYQDTAHFNREYQRLFDAPPMRDVQRLRTAAGESAGP
jgi:transcriptional regulator GlxA family with amidase domain